MVYESIYPAGGSLPVVYATEKYIYCLLSRVLESNGRYIRDLHLERDSTAYVVVLNWVSYLKDFAGTVYINPVASPQRDSIPFRGRFHDALVRYACKEGLIISEPQIVYLVQYTHCEKGPNILLCSKTDQ